MGHATRLYSKSHRIQSTAGNRCTHWFAVACLRARSKNLWLPKMDLNINLSNDKGRFTPQKVATPSGKLDIMDCTWCQGNPPKVRIAIPPLRRRVIHSESLRSWLSMAMQNLAISNPIRAEFSHIFNRPSCSSGSGLAPRIGEIPIGERRVPFHAPVCA